MHWRYAKRIIVDLELEPFTWATKINRDKIYHFFEKKKTSLSYMQKVVRAMNLWGEFLGEKQNKFYRPLAMPKGHQRERIRDANQNSGKRTNESQPLTPELLHQAKAHMREDHYTGST